MLDSVLALYSASFVVVPGKTTSSVAIGRSFHPPRIQTGPNPVAAFRPGAVEGSSRLSPAWNLWEINKHPASSDVTKFGHNSHINMPLG